MVLEPSPHPLRYYDTPVFNYATRVHSCFFGWNTGEWILFLITLAIFTLIGEGQMTERKGTVMHAKMLLTVFAKCSK